MQKRILALAPSSYIGGAEKVTLDILSGLKDNNFKIHCIINGWNDGDFPSRLRTLNIDCTPIKLGWYYLKKIRWSLDSLLHYPGAIIKFLKVVKRFPYDLVYLTTYRSILLLYPFLKKNIIYHVHDPNSTAKQSRILLKIADKKVLRYVAVSNFIRTDLIKCGVDKDKIEVVYNGIDIPFNVKEEKIGNNTNFTVGVVGQVIPRKGHEDVLEALKILKDKGYNNIKLLVVGKGDEAFVAKLKSLIDTYRIKDLITWRGYQQELDDIYQGIDVVLAVTRNDEPFGLIAIEANAMNIPVIVSRKGGLVEIVEEGRNGFIVNAYSPHQIAEKILLLYNNSELKKEMGERGKQKVATSFTKRKMIQGFIGIISQL